MSVVPSPTASVDQLVADPVPNLSGFIVGTDTKGNSVHIAVAHIVIILPGENYNTFAMDDGRNLLIVTFQDTTP